MSNGNIYSETVLVSRRIALNLPGATKSIQLLYISPTDVLLATTRVFNRKYTDGNTFQKG